ncbi:IS701 family transposase, partial [Nocardiopsis lucentensis]|uniref:IS701 family transposase n=1 Tax=Nocardiopsis lucentensis TaxID=53441 RepID=UPI00036C07F9
MTSTAPAITGPAAWAADRDPPAADSDIGPDASLVSEVLSALRRSDQRHKGGMYVRGLLTVPGRKTMRGLAAHTGEHAAEQSLHHFISSSTWDWSRLRVRLAHRLERDLGPRAWVVRPMVVPKAGTQSVGVERRYVPHLGQAVNCQHSWGLWFAADHGSAPVNWQLSLGDDWLGDDDLRRRVAIPDELRVASPDAIAAGVVAQAAGWGLTPRPVVMDAREVAPAPVIRALSAAGLPFMLRVSGGTNLLAPELSGGARTVAATAERLAGLVPSRRRPVEWVDPVGPPITRTSLLSLLPVHWPRLSPVPGPSYRGPVSDTRRGRPQTPPLTLVAEWRPNRPRPTELWV